MEEKERNILITEDEIRGKVKEIETKLIAEDYKEKTLCPICMHWKLYFHR